MSTPSTFRRRMRDAAGVVIIALLLSACGSPSSPQDSDGPRYVTTIPPFEMILTPVVEGRASVVTLLDPGASPHTYDPTPSDLRATTTSTALVYGAEHLDGWTADLPAHRRLELVPLLPPTSQLRFGEHDSHGGETVDPHFWTDPVAVTNLLPALVDTLCAIDTAGCPTYRANADSFTTALATLDTRLQTLTEPIRDTPVLLAQPFYRYFLHRYGPRLVGVLEPRPGTEPTPRQLSRLIDEARRAEARGILTQASLSGRVARVVSEASRLPVVQIDPLGGVEGRRTYSELLLSNAGRLRDSLAQRD